MSACALVSVRHPLKLDAASSLASPALLVFFSHDGAIRSSTVCNPFGNASEDIPQDERADSKHVNCSAVEKNQAVIGLCRQSLRLTAFSSFRLESSHSGSFPLYDAILVQLSVPIKNVQVV